MKVYTLLRKGEFHAVQCEDFLVNQAIDNRFYFGAVLDGCSGGKEAHFASALMGKILRKVCKLLPYEKWFMAGDTDVKALTKHIYQGLFKEMQIAQNQLLLDKYELLATCITMIYDSEKQEAFIVIIGDGFAAADRKVWEIDQNNRPDYMAYHLHKDFDEWYETQQNRFFFEQPKDISIATDGIDVFTCTNSIKVPPAIDPKEHFLVNQDGLEEEFMLEKKSNKLWRDFRFVPTDDLAIVRLIL